MIFLQRDDANAADVHFSGEQARILKDGVVVQDWVDGGVIEGVPQGGGYTLEILRDGEVVSEELAIGIVVGAIGQSNMSFWFGNADSTANVVQASPGTYQLVNGQLSDVRGDAARTFANHLSEATGVPVAIVDGSLGGTALLSKYGNANGSWEATGEGSLYEKFLTKLDAVGGRAELVLWIQGENDARAGATTAEYLDGLNALFARLETDVAPNAIVASKLGNTVYGDPEWTPYMTAEQGAAIREAQALADAAHADVTFVDSVDLELHDAIHRTTISSANESIRLADAYLSAISASPIRQVGTDADDVIAGSQGSDVIEGGLGDDEIDAADGDDLVRGGSGADTVSGGLGNDLLSGGGGDDVLLGGEGNDRISGDAGDDHIDAGAGDDVASGGAGDDEIDGGDGNDVIDGGLGNDVLRGGDGNDKIRLTGGSDTVDAGDGDDVIVVERYSLYNYTGSDQGHSSTIDGGAGQDVLSIVGNANVAKIAGISGVEIVTAAGYSGVTIAGSDGADHLDFRLTALIGIQAISGNAGDDTIYGSEAADRISGDGGVDHLFGGGGNDILMGGADDDIVDGGAGIDTLQLSSTFAASTIDRALGRIGSARDGNDTVSNIEFVNFVDGVYDWTNGTFDATPPFSGVLINGTSKSDVINPTTTAAGQPKASAFNDVIYGFAGSDHLDGGAGADTMIGGADGDTYYVDEASDQVVELAGEGTDLVYASVSYALSDNVERLKLTGSAAIDGTGNALGNFLTGNDAANILTAGGGDDRLYGEGGADTLIGGMGNDLYYVDNAADRVVEALSEGTDTVNATASFVLSDNVENLTLTGSLAIDGTGNALANILTGNAADNVLRGGGGADNITGAAGDDTLFGDAGNDRLDGGIGTDRMLGGAGDDTYIVGDTSDEVIEFAGEGNDTVSASVSFTLSAQVERLTLTGSGAIDGVGNDLANTLTGNAAANTLFGGGGSDTIDGGLGVDTAAFAGVFANYAINRTAGTVTSAAEGADKIKNVELLQFSNGVYDWTSGTFTPVNTPPKLTAAVQVGTLIEATAGSSGSASATIALTRGDADAGDTVSFDTTGWSQVDATHWSKFGTYGTAVLDTATGALAYTLDNGRAQTNALAGGVTVQDAFSVRVHDASGATATATAAFAITGSDDRAVLSSAAGTLIESNAASSLSASGSLTIFDVDSSTSFIAASIAGAFGTFSIDPSGAWTYVATSAHDELAAGELHTERFAITATDGTTTSVRLDVIGTNDGPVLHVDDQVGTLIEATSGSSGSASATIALTRGDADAGDTVSFDTTGWSQVDATHWSKVGTYGTAVLDTATGALAYTLDNDRAQTNALAGGVTVQDAFSVRVHDASGAIATATAAFAITGSDDPAVLSAATGSLIESNAASSLSASGSLAIFDADSSTRFNSASIAGAFGTFSIDPSGAWTYVATSAHDELAAGERHIERFAVTATDGTTTSVTLDIVGTNDGPVLHVGDQIGAVIEATSGSSGSASASIDLTRGDIDAGDTVSFDTTGWSQVDATHWSKLGTYGTAVLDTASGALAYTLDNDRVQTNALAGGVAVQDAFSIGIHDASGATATATAAFAIAGSDDGVLINGTSRSDVIGPTATVSGQPKASAFDDVIYGFAGSDRLDGGAGADTMIGGTDGDSYYVDDAADQVVELAGEGIDFVYASVSYALSDNVERLTLTGSAAIDGTGNALGNFLTGNDAANILTGGGGDDRLYGEGGADTLIGGTGNDLYYVDNGADRVVEALSEGTDTVNATASFVLSDNLENLTLTGSLAIDGTGNALANILTGNAADNVLRGDGGADYLAGGGGRDAFVFDTVLDAKRNVDIVSDFNVAEDRIGLDGRIFAALGPVTLRAAEFVLGKSAATSDQHVIYDSSTGKLFYDADGVGGAAQTQFALLNSGLGLTADSFFIL